MNYDNFENASPNAAHLVQALRAVGYDTKNAIADLVDNSITAKAKNISINFSWNNNNPIISVMDDGCGMNESALLEAMRLGSVNPLLARDINDLGRWGLGLKTASFSQCKRLTVITKKEKDNVVIRCWDLDVITEENEWILLKTCSTDAETIYKDYFSKNTHGTIVVWEKLDKLVPDDCLDDYAYQDSFLKCASQVKKHISKIFSEFMHGYNKIVFSLNGNVIDAWDPFMESHIFTTILQSEYLYIGNSPVKVTVYILPHQNRLTPEEYTENAGELGWTEQQGFYLYRNNRMILGADWLVEGMQKKEQYKLARIRIDIDNTTDLMWNVDVKKSMAIPPVSIKDELKRIAKVAQKHSAAIYRHRGKKISRNAKKEVAFLWKQIVRFGKIGYSINREHPVIKDILQSGYKKEISVLLDLLEETVPVPLIISEYSENPDKMLTPFEGKEIDDFDQMFENILKVYVENMQYTMEDAIATLAGTEPFVYSPEKIELYCLRKGINYGE